MTPNWSHYFQILSEGVALSLALFGIFWLTVIGEALSK